MKKNLFFGLTIFLGLGFCSVHSQNIDDAAVLEVAMDDVYTAGGTANNVNIRFINAGTNTINPLTFNWSVDGGTTVNSYVVAFPLSSGFSSTIAHSTKITFANPGTFTNLMVWTSNPNGNTDSNTSNDTLRKQIFVNNGLTVSRNVFVEEFSTAPCGFCPDGAVVLEGILANNPSTIASALHAGFGTDAMTIPEHSTVASAFTNSAPSAAIDRVKWTGQNRVAIGRGLWNNRISLRRGLNSPLTVSIAGVPNLPANAVNVTVIADFADFVLPGDIRVGLYVIEDSVSGLGSGYNQVNYDNTTAGHPYQGAGNPIIGYIHRHVVRDVYPASNPWGVSGVIPNAPQPNTPYSTTFSVALNSAWKTKDLKFAAFVSYYNTSVEERVIINAEEISYSNLVTSVSDLSSPKTATALKLYPNPSNGISFLEYELKKNEEVSIRLFDLRGKLILSENVGTQSAGKQRFQLNMDALPNGLYFIEFTAGSSQLTKKLTVNK